MSVVAVVSKRQDDNISVSTETDRTALSYMIETDSTALSSTYHRLIIDRDEVGGLGRKSVPDEHPLVFWLTMPEYGRT